MGSFNPFSGEGLLVLLVVLLLFGSKRLPDAARSLGRSMRILKAETKGLREDDTPPSALPAGETDADRDAREYAEWKAQRADRTETR
jgi:sec-independent protein translocase protein TatA